MNIEEAMALRNEALQEKRLQQAQRMLDRIKKLEEKAKQQVELEMKRLEGMRSGQEDQLTSYASVEPALENPALFESQYDQFSDTLSSQRLDPNRRDTPGQLKPLGDEPENGPPWQTLREDPDVPVYVSGYYYSSGSGTKHYEYELEASALPISVGDMVEAPVHYKGHGDGRSKAGHDRRFIVTDIYTKERFQQYHDSIRK